MLNKAILMGRLTRDPDLRHTQSNMAVASFSLAIDRGRKDANGNRQTDFIDCVAWGRQAEFVKQWFTKGMMAIVVGRIQSRNWEDKNGSKRVSIEINCDEISFGETRKAREENGYGYAQQGGGYADSYNAPQRAPQNYNSAPAAPAFDMPTGSSDFAELSDDDDDGDVPF